MLECMLCAVYEGHFTHRIIPPLSYFLFKLSILSNYLLNNIRSIYFILYKHAYQLTCSVDRYLSAMKPNE